MSTLPAAASTTIRSWRIAENQNACCDEQLRRRLRAFEAGHRREVARIEADSQRARSSGSSAFSYLDKRNARAVRTAAKADGPGSRTLQLARSALIRLRLMEQPPQPLLPQSPQRTATERSVGSRPSFRLHLLPETRVAELLAGAESRRRRRLEAVKRSGQDLDGKISAFLRPPASSEDNYKKFDKRTENLPTKGSRGAVTWR